MRTRNLVVLTIPLALLATLVLAWTRHRPAESQAPRSQSCIYNGDCADNMICEGRFCRNACLTDRDCTGGQRCVTRAPATWNACAPKDFFAKQTTWTPIFGTLAQLAVQNRHTIFGITAGQAGGEGPVVRLLPRSTAPVGGSARMRRLAVGPTGDLWAIAADAKVMHLENNRWVSVTGAPESATDVAVGQDGSVFVAAKGEIFVRSPQSSGWVVAAPKTGTPVKVAAAAEQKLLVAVSDDGSPAAGQVVDGQYRLAKLPGTVSEIAAVDTESIWSVNAQGQVFRWSYGGWDLQPGTLTDVAVGFDGSVVGVNAAGRVFMATVR